MKRHGDLWDRLVSWPNLVRALHKARRGKRHRPDVLRFTFAAEWELLRLRQELLDESYRPGPFHTHRIQRPKSRLISAAPFRDRVVHHALMNVLEPILERRFHPHSYACRKGKGTHAAARRLQVLMRRCRWLVPGDVCQFFPSIDHVVLKTLSRGFLKDGRVLALLDRIVDHSNEQDPVRHYFPGDDLFTPLQRRRGLPIGNLTSQWLANLYLDGLDHWLGDRFRLGGYVRYCDDFVLLDGDRGKVREAAAAVKDRLGELRLRLHEERALVRPVRAGLTFVGYRIWPTHRFVSKGNLHRYRRRLRWLKRAYARGGVDSCAIQQRLMSWLGHARQADSAGLIARLAAEWCFRRAGTAEAGP